MAERMAKIKWPKMAFYIPVFMYAVINVSEECMRELLRF